MRERARAIARRSTDRTRGKRRRQVAFGDSPVRAVERVERQAEQRGPARERATSGITRTNQSEPAHDQVFEPMPHVSCARQSNAGDRRPATRVGRGARYGWRVAESRQASRLRSQHANASAGSMVAVERHRGDRHARDRGGLEPHGILFGRHDNRRRRRPARPRRFSRHHGR